MTAEQIAEMANRAETEILKAISPEMRDWYLSLPRATRVQMAADAFKAMAQ